MLLEPGDLARFTEGDETYQKVSAQMPASLEYSPGKAVPMPAESGFSFDPSALWGKFTDMLQGSGVGSVLAPIVGKARDIISRGESSTHPQPDPRVPAGGLRDAGLGDGNFSLGGQGYSAAELADTSKSDFNLERRQRLYSRRNDPGIFTDGNNQLGATAPTWGSGQQSGPRFEPKSTGGDNTSWVTDLLDKVKGVLEPKAEEAPTQPEAQKPAPATPPATATPGWTPTKHPPGWMVNEMQTQLGEKPTMSQASPVAPPQVSVTPPPAPRVETPQQPQQSGGSGVSIRLPQGVDSATAQAAYDDIRRDNPNPQELGFTAKLKLQALRLTHPEVYAQLQPHLGASSWPDVVFQSGG